MIEEEIVYVRTDEGEAKAKQPRSISSHELRAMLLLIDGRLSVRELRRRFGKSLAIDKSIGELSRLGWVERDEGRDGLEMDLVDHKSIATDETDSVEESPDVAREEIHREAQALAESHIKVEEIDVPVSEISGRNEDAMIAAAEVEPETEPDRAQHEAVSPRDAELAATDMDAPDVEEQTAEMHPDEAVTIAPEPESASTEPSPPPVDAQERAEPVLDLSDERDVPDATETLRQEPGVDADVDAVQTAETPSDGSGSDRHENEPERFGEYAGPNMSDRARGGMIAARFLVERLWRLFLPVAALLVVLALVAAAFLLPERHEDDIVAALERHVGSPVAVQGVHLSREANGSLAIERVSFARLPSIKARSIYLVPDWAASLRAVDWRFRAQVDGLDGTPGDLSRLLSGLQLDGSVSSIDFVDAGVRVGAERWAGYGGSFDIAGAAGERMILLENGDRSLTLRVSAIPGGLSVETVGIRQGVALFPAVKFDSYELKADMLDEQVKIRSFGAAGYGGKVSAQGVLTTLPVLNLEADLTLSKVDAKRLVDLAGSRVVLEGAVDATLKMTAAAESASEMTRIDTLEGDFSIDTGVLGRMDIGAALRERGTGKLQGGETRFETVKGLLDYKDRVLDVRITTLDAGALDANGRLRIAADESLSGRIGAAVASGGRRIRVPVSISGTVATPVLETPKPVLVPIAPPKPAEIEPSIEDPSGLPGDEVPVGPGQLR